MHMVYVLNIYLERDNYTDLFYYTMIMNSILLLSHNFKIERL